MNVQFQFYKSQMAKQRNFQLITFLMGIAFFLITTAIGFAQQSDIKRAELQRYDLELSEREVIQVRIDFPVGTAFGKHKHPGEEFIYVIDGLLEYKVEGSPPVTLTAGQVLFIPSGSIHEAKNAGSVNASELATYVVKKGKPLVVLTQ